MITVDIIAAFGSDELPQIWDELRKKVRDVRASLPPGAGKPAVSDDFGDVFGFLMAVVGDGFTWGELERYVDGVGERLARASDRPGLVYHFQILDTPVVNAFALPGGFLYVTRGMLEQLNSEDELAHVLGHELAHVTGRHGASMVSKALVSRWAVPRRASNRTAVIVAEPRGVPAEVNKRPPRVRNDSRSTSANTGSPGASGSRNGWKATGPSSGRLGGGSTER